MAANGKYAGKIAFVTGAGSGIGRATALTFAREGAAVARDVTLAPCSDSAAGPDISRFDDAHAAAEEIGQGRGIRRSACSNSVAREARNGGHETHG